MSTDLSSGAVYVTNDFSEPLSARAQHNFARHYDLDNPMEAMSTYSRVMHQHTRQQLQMATSSEQRRRSGGSSSPGSGTRQQQQHSHSQHHLSNGVVPTPTEARAAGSGSNRDSRGSVSSQDS